MTAEMIDMGLFIVRRLVMINNCSAYGYILSKDVTPARGTARLFADRYRKLAAMRTCAAIRLSKRALAGAHAMRSAYPTEFHHVLRRETLRILV
jgi:hypothetical protein